eukprot:COSAG01_NODE_6109_length_3845_cov_11.171116_3_plen_485_part_00
MLALPFVRFGPTRTAGELPDKPIVGLDGEKVVSFECCVIEPTGLLKLLSLGVRRTAIAALTVSVVGRGIFTFARSRNMIWLSALTFSPFGEAVLSTGIYTVALRKLTPPSLRPLAFAVQYASFNFSGALCDVAIDALRLQDDREILGARFSGLRTFVLTTWLAVWAALLLVIFYVRDVTVVDPSDPESDTDGLSLPSSDIFGVPLQQMPPPPPPRGARRCRWCCTGGMMGAQLDRALRWRQQSLHRYRLVHTPLRSVGVTAELREVWGAHGAVTATIMALRHARRGAAAVLRLRSLWRVICFSLCTFFVSKQWGDTATMLIPFLERHYGEDVPAYTIHSINLWGCLLLPPLVGAVSGAAETFSVILPGMWLMAVSPVWVTIWPTVFGSVMWLIFLTLGEVAWSPRHSAWAASVAPVGREGIFVAVASIKSLLISWPSNYVNGYMNQEWNPNCRQCRDNMGRTEQLRDYISSNGMVAQSCSVAQC